jgi:3-hexulose-6-phosphate synthase
VSHRQPHVNLDRLSRAIVQLSLDLTSIDEAIDTAAVGVEAGVDWLEAGTPLLLAEGLHAVETLRARFPDHPIVADLKTMDGGYLEAEMMAKAGADFVVVMGRAHEATIRRVIDAGHDFGIRVMGDNLGTSDRVTAAEWMEGLGVDVIVHHIGRVPSGRLKPVPDAEEDLRRDPRGRNNMRCEARCARRVESRNAE